MHIKCRFFSQSLHAFLQLPLFQKNPIKLSIKLAQKYDFFHFCKEIFDDNFDKF